MRMWPQALSLVVAASFYLNYDLPASLLCEEAAAQGIAMEAKRTAPSKMGRSLMDMTAEELRHAYPSELRGMEFIPNQEGLESLLVKMGERIQTFFRDFSNTSSKEEVLLKRFGVTGRLESSIGQTYTYLLLFNPDDTQPLIQEYRTDKKFRAISQEAIRGFFITSGYSCLSVLFHPNYLQDSSFRYLGKQPSDQGAHLIAFIQKPETKRNLTKFTDIDVGQSIRVLQQGIVWVDPNTYQILRMRTSLVTGAKASFAATQDTDIQFGEVRFEGVLQQYWLPKNVTVHMVIAGKTYDNLHRYSGYQVFSTDSEVQFAPPQAPR